MIIFEIVVDDSKDADILAEYIRENIADLDFIIDINYKIESVEEPVEEQMKMYAVREDVLNAVIQYLMTQPYGQVANIMQGLSQAQEVENAPEPLEKEYEPYDA